MSLNIGGFISRLLPSFNKSELEVDLDISIENIPVVVEAYTNLANTTKVADLKAPKNIDVVKVFYKELSNTKYSVKLNPGKHIANDIISFMNNLTINSKYLRKEMSDALNDVIVSQALTAYKANIIRSVPHVYYMVKFALNLLNYIYVNETEYAGIVLDKNSKLNKKQEKVIVDNMWIFARLLTVYGDNHDKFKAKIENIEAYAIPKEEVDNIIEIYKADKVDIFNNLPNGFIGSPIYTIRLVFAQWEADRYRDMKDKKKLLELRYLYLKQVREQGNTDISIETEITHLQKRVTDLDYKLAKIEESVSDE